MIIKDSRSYLLQFSVNLKALMDRTHRNAKPHSTVYPLRDQNSLAKSFGNTVVPAGSRIFFLSYTPPTSGTRTQVNLSRYPGTNLKDARNKAQAHRDRLAVGINPRDKIKDYGETDAALAACPTVSSMFDAYIDDLEIDGKRSTPDARRIFSKHINDVTEWKI